MDGPERTALEDLAHRLGVDRNEIEVLESRAVTWRNSALGCPKPGAAYLQVLTPGVLIRLRCAGREYRYHGARGASPFLCEAALPELPLPPRDAEE